MIAAEAMTKISIPESLGLSVLGLVIVFIVLVFLMVIIYVMTAIIRKISSKPATVIGRVDVPIQPVSKVDTKSDTPLPAAPVTEASVDTVSVLAEPAAAPATDPEFLAARKYRVVVDGVEYEVDAEMEGSVFQSGSGRGN